MDPIADEFAWVSPYNYAENEPVGSIDLHGLQKINVNDLRNPQGQIIRREATVSVNVKVINLSSKENFSFNNSLSRIGNTASKSFNSSFSSQVFDSKKKQLTQNEVPIEVKFNLSVEQVSNINQVKETDFISLIVDKINGNVAGKAKENENISIIDAQYLSGSSSEVLLHELGHNLGLDHTIDGKGLMGEKLNGQTSLSKSELKSMYLGLSIGGISREQKQQNSKAVITDLLKENASKYDKNKSKKAGID